MRLRTFLSLFATLTVVIATEPCDGSSEDSSTFFGSEAAAAMQSDGSDSLESELRIERIALMDGDAKSDDGISIASSYLSLDLGNCADPPADEESAIPPHIDAYSKPPRETSAAKDYQTGQTVVDRIGNCMRAVDKHVNPTRVAILLVLVTAILALVFGLIKGLNN